MIGTIDYDVAAALEAAGLRARSWREVSTIRASAVRRSAYRIDLESGETIKARRLEDAGTARRLFEVRQELPDAFVPAFMCHGPVLLERWVEGEILGSTPPSDAHLRQAGLLLAGLHATPAVAGQPVGRRERTAAWRDEAERGLGTVVEAGALDATVAAELRRILERADPGLATTGLTHVDFCGENMLLDQARRLRVFDNDRVGTSMLGFDLARTWYRWNLASPAWASFQAVYASGLSSMEALETLDFWGIVAPVKSAVFRIDADRARVDVPLDRLRRIAGAGGCGSRL